MGAVQQPTEGRCRKDKARTRCPNLSRLVSAAARGCNNAVLNEQVRQTFALGFSRAVIGTNRFLIHLTKSDCELRAGTLETPLRQAEPRAQHSS